MLITDSENGDVYEVEIKGGLMTRKLVKPSKSFRIDTLKNLRAAGLSDQCMTWVYDHIPPNDLVPAIAVPDDIESLQQVEDLLNTAYGLVSLQQIELDSKVALPGVSGLSFVAVSRFSSGIMLRNTQTKDNHILPPTTLVRPLK